MALSNRRSFLRAAAAAAGWGLAVPLFAACSAPGGPSPAPTPTTAAKPTAPPKPAAPAAPAASPPSASGGPAASPSPGASPSPAAAAPAPAAKPAAPAASTLTKVSYGIVSYNPFHIVIIAATEKPEFMSRHGIEVDLILTGSSPAAVAAMVGGSMNLTTATAESAWPAQDREPDVKQVLAVAVGTPYSLIVNPEIKRIADLRGKPVGSTAIRGGADTTALRSLLAEHGLNDGDYNVVVVGSIAERTAAMKANTVMGVAQLEPQATQLLDAGFVELDNADNYPRLRAPLSVSVIGKKSWYEPNMDTAARFLKGWIDVTKWIYEPRNKDEMIAIVAKTMKVETKAATNAYERHIVKSKTPPVDPHITLAMSQAAAEAQKRIGAPVVPTDLEKYFDNRIVDRAMAS